MAQSGLMRLNLELSIQGDQAVVTGLNRVDNSVGKVSGSSGRMASELDQSGKAMGRMSSSSQQTASSFGLLRGAIAPVMAALVALSSLTVFSRMINEAELYERNMLRTEALVRATGQAAGFTAKQLRRQAEDLALATLQSVDGVEKAQQILLTFRSVSGETFTRATELAADLATVTGTSLNSAMTQLGKALEDPIQGVNALRRSGVSFTEQQKETLQALVDTNQTAEAQKLILDELAQQYGGVARAEAEGFSGMLDTMSQRWDELNVAMGESAVIADNAETAIKALTDVFVDLRKAIAPTGEEMLAELETQLQHVKGQLEAQEEAGMLGWLWGSREGMQKRAAELQTQIEKMKKDLESAAKENAGTEETIVEKSSVKISDKRIREFQRAGAEIKDLWQVQTEERYEVHRRGLGYIIADEQEAAKTAAAAWTAGEDAWLQKRKEFFEVKSRGLDILIQEEKQWEKISEQIGQSLTDSLMEGGKNAWEYIQDLFRTMVLRPLLQPVVGAVAGGVTTMLQAGQVFAGTGGGTGDAAEGSAGILGGVFSDGLSGLFNQGVFAGLQDTLAIGLLEFGAENLALSLVSMSDALFGSLTAGLGSALIAGLTSGDWGQAAISGIGSGIGFALGGPIGAIAGGAIANLFGNDKPSNKAAWGNIDLSTGDSFGLGNMTGSKQASSETIAARDELLEYVSDLSAVIRSLGGSIDGELYLDIGERDGVWIDIGNGREVLGKEMEEVMSGLTRAVFEGVNWSGVFEQHAAFGLMTREAQQAITDALGSDSLTMDQVQGLLSQFNELGGVMAQLDEQLTLSGMTEYERQVYQVNQQFDILAATLQSAGIDLEQYTAVEELRSQKLAELAEQQAAVIQQSLERARQEIEAFQSNLMGRQLHLDGQSGAADLLSLKISQANELQAAIDKGYDVALLKAVQEREYAQAVTSQISDARAQLAQAENQYQAVISQAAQQAAQQVESAQQNLESAERNYQLVLDQQAEAARAAARRVAEAWRSVAENLERSIEALFAGENSPLSEGQKLIQARSLFEADVNAALRGDLDAAGRLSGRADDYAALARGTSGSAAEYNTAFGRIVAAMETVRGSAERQGRRAPGVVAEDQLAKAAEAVQLAKEQLAEAKAEAERAKVIDYEQLALAAEAVQTAKDNLATAIEADAVAAAAYADLQDITEQSLTTLDQQLTLAQNHFELSRTNAEQAHGDAMVIASHLSQLGGGLDLPGFATGTNYVPYDMTARVHKGEAIVPRKYNPAAGGSMGTEAVAEIRVLREELRAQARANVQLQHKLVKLVDGWDKNGMPEERVVA